LGFAFSEVAPFADDVKREARYSMGEHCNGLYGSGALAKLRELHSAFAKSGNECQRGSEARKEWERALGQAGPALLSAAEENERLLTLIRMIACNNDAEWGRQLARHHLGFSNPHATPAVGPGNSAPACRVGLAAAIIEQIFDDADALFRQRLKDRGFELPYLVIAVTPDGQAVLRGNVSADVLRSFGEGLKDVADELAGPPEAGVATH
jgi:hypothetical protein